MNLSIVDLHHKVLILWSRWRRKSGSPAPDVLVLDHHTDVMPAFRDPGRTVDDGAWSDPKKVQKAVLELRHDEHFNWAVRSGLVRSCTISSHVNATPVSDPRLMVRCHSGWQDENHVFAEPDRFRPLADRVLESDYLCEVFGKTLPPHFILDIDCDYFTTEKSFHPGDISFFREMVRKAEWITVSQEKDWVRLLRFPGETFIAEDVIRELFQM